jgi:membrane-associated protease RseP (regulator of RpoE activity)
MTFPDTEIVTTLVQKIFRVDDITFGDPDRDFIVRYRGQLISDDSAGAYDQLSAALHPYGATPLFRVDDQDGRHLIYIKKGVIESKPSNSTINIILFILTVIAVIMAGMGFGDADQILAAQDAWEQTKIAILTGGIPFALTLLTILLFHEFGHYFAARYHKTNATLPYFIPLPIIGILGTMGAVIVWKEPPRNRRVLFDVGVAGPLSGLIVTIPLLYLGLSLSRLDQITLSPVGSFIEGNSLLYLIMKFVVFGQWLPAPIDYAGLSPMFFWIKYFFTGQPIPLGGTDVMIGPVAFAAWAGLLVTAMNLIPAGQLDGGHIAYVLLGSKTRYLLPIMILIIGILAIFWNGWWMFIAVLLLFGRAHPEPLDQITQIDPTRRALALCMILVFILVFIPIPFSIIPPG